MFECTSHDLPLLWLYPFLLVSEVRNLFYMRFTLCVLICLLLVFLEDSFNFVLRTQSYPIIFSHSLKNSVLKKFFTRFSSPRSINSSRFMLLQTRTKIFVTLFSTLCMYTMYGRRDIFTYSVLPFPFVQSPPHCRFGIIKCPLLSRNNDARGCTLCVVISKNL